MPQHKFLILDSCGHQTSAQLCSCIGASFNCDIQVVEDRQDILSLVNHWHPELLFSVTDKISTRPAVEIMEHFCLPEILVLCTEGLQKQGVDFFSDHFDDFIIPPFREAEVVYRIRRCLGELIRDEKESAKKNILSKLGIAQVIGKDPAFLEVISKIPLIADCDATILLSGETGVGKEVCARAIHYLSNRSDKSFIPVNCGAIPTNLLENELFGHKRGAFTDARSNQSGLIAEAEGGTLFLDEIDALPLEAQSKVLRLLQDKSYRPLGHTRNMQADIRVIAATNVDLRQKIQQGAFREDLFYRLSVVNLQLPSLRERKNDIPLLADYFLRKYSKEYGRGHKLLSRTAVQKLLLYDWPGNIRELENIIQQAILLTPNSVIQSNNINLPISMWSRVSETPSFREAKKSAIEQFEREYITQLLISCDGNITRAAKEAKKDRRDFGRLVKKYKLNAKSFQPL
ncbi:MAG: sigma-54 interaction domain-containing protein [bacterium]